jgi:hypothetical protein
MYLGTNDYWVGILSFNQVCISGQTIIGLGYSVFHQSMYLGTNNCWVGIWISIKHISRDEWLLGWNIEFQSRMYLGTNDYWVGILSFNLTCILRQTIIELGYTVFNQCMYLGTNDCWVGIWISIKHISRNKWLIVGSGY